MADVQVHVGVDVGGTYTDAVVMGMSREDPTRHEIISTAKHITTSDVTTGICKALGTALDGALDKIKPGEELKVQRIHIGTTQFINAVVQRKGLCKVAALRLCGPATVSLPPFVDIPSDLTEVICGAVELLDGGYEYDGITEIKPVKKEQVLDVIKKLKERGINNVVVTGIFSHLNAQHEKKVESLFKEHFPEASLTLSHTVGHTGLLERENASILNESLKPLCRHTLTAYRAALGKLGLKCPIYLTQNDGTLTSADRALHMPILTFASGPTNSMRGAAFLGEQEQADTMLVIDIGGTTSDVGILHKGFPRETQMKVKVGGVRTNFRMPDVLSVGLGGGSLVCQQKSEPSSVTVGPQSTGYRLTTEGLVFGGTTLTASDIAVAFGLADMGDQQKVEHLDPQLLHLAMNAMRRKVEDAIDHIKTGKEDVPAILVGGGSVLIQTDKPLEGTSRASKPDHFDVANAVGAALSKVSGTDEVIRRGNITRAAAMDMAMKAAKEKAIEAGADPNTLEITEKRATEVQYVNDVTNIRMKAVGNLLWNKDNKSLGSTWSRGVHEGVEIGKDEAAQQVMTSTGQLLDADEQTAVKETAPLIDAATGDWILSEWDIVCLSVGCTVLGCGGGGNTYTSTLLALRELRQGKQIRIIKPEVAVSRMVDEDRVANVGSIGAPSVASEKLQSGEGIRSVLDCMQELYSVGMYADGKLHNCEDVSIKEDEGLRYIENYHPAYSDAKGSRSDTVKALGCLEIGGQNGIDPLCAAAFIGLPVVDCDAMGRAFPETQHFSIFIEGSNPYPAVLTDVNDTRHVVLYAKSPKQLENHCREACVKMGCCANAALSPLTREDISLRTVHRSYSRAWCIGRAVLRARQEKVSPVSAIVEHAGGKVLATGKISDVETKVIDGFNKGKVTIEAFEDRTDGCFIIHFQNEFLICQCRSKDGSCKTVACTPDLISLVEVDTGEPVPVDEVRYGLRVAILTLPVPPLMSTPQALRVVGPQAFGYSEDEVVYTPVGPYVVDAYPWIAANEQSKKATCSV